MKTLARGLSTVLFPLLLAACATTPGSRPATPSMPAIPATWVAEPLPGDEIDSVSVWRRDDAPAHVIATAKKGHRLVLLDADTGRLAGELGRHGSAPGEFSAPNGIAIDGDLAFVVDRDNRRVQVLQLTSGNVIGTFGDDALRRPFGLWLRVHGGGFYHVYVTDSFDVEPGVEPPGMDGRVKRYAVRLSGSGLEAQLEGRFGEMEGEAALRYVESVWGDPPHNRLLVADEYPEHRDIKVFDMAGRFTGAVIGQGMFTGEPEGLTLIECGDDGGGYWLVSDQDPDQQAFHLFERRSLARVGSFRSDDARMVDGLWFQPGPSGRFPAGVLFTQSNDITVVAFDWQHIVEALSLRRDCGL